MRPNRPGRGKPIHRQGMTSRIRVVTSFATVPVGFQRARVVQNYRDLKDREFLLSNGLVGFSKDHFKYLAQIIARKWDLSSYRERFNGVWIKVGSKILPAALTKKELVTLAKKSGLEIADATRVVFEIDGTSLVVTDQRIPEGALLNSEIRAAITSYLKGESEIIPPPLFAEADEEGKAHVCDDLEGNPIYVKVGRGAEFFSHPLACITVISRHELQRVLHSRGKSRLTSIRLADDFLVPAKPVVKGRPKREESNLVKEWALGSGKLIVTQISRRIQSKGSIQLFNFKGMPFWLKGLYQAYKLGVREVTLTFQQETVLEKPNCKIVRLYDARFVDPAKDPDNWFAMFEVHEGLKINLNGKQIGELRLEFARGGS